MSSCFERGIADTHSLSGEMVTSRRNRTGLPPIRWLGAKVTCQGVDDAAELRDQEWTTPLGSRVRWVTRVCRAVTGPTRATSDPSLDESTIHGLPATAAIA